jgi:hypothetical protein
MEGATDLLSRLDRFRDEVRDALPRLRGIKMFLDTVDAALKVIRKQEKFLRRTAECLDLTTDEALDMLEEGQPIPSEGGLPCNMPALTILKTDAPGHHRYRLRVDGISPEYADEAVATLDRSMTRYSAKRCDVQSSERSVVIMLTPRTTPKPDST